MKFIRTATLVFLLSLALVGVSPPAAGQILDNLDGTVTDARTGMVWVADPAFVIDAGLASDILMTKARALELVAAMNAGEIESFGRRWRLPRYAELEHFLQSERLQLLRLRVAAARSGEPMALFMPVKAGSAPPGFETVVLFATNSIHMKKGSDVISGDVVVNAPSPGPHLAGTHELTIGQNAATASGYEVKADSIKLQSRAAVACDDGDSDDVCDNVFCNELEDNNSGVVCTPLGTDPVFETLPQFIAEAPRPDALDVTVAAEGSASLAAGDYGDVTVGVNATLTFVGGIYNVRSIHAEKGADLLFAAASEVRVEGKLMSKQNVVFGPAPGSGLAAGEIIVYVAGFNGDTGAIDGEPAAAEIGRSNLADANISAPNGTLRLRQGAIASGVFQGRDVVLEADAQVTLASAFTNLPPTADPQEVFTDGTKVLTITLTGSDPDFDSLSFSIVTPPTQGTLTDLTPIVPAPIEDPENPGNFVQPPTVSATVKYTPATGDDLEDSFVFQVADGNGGVGQATVTINPPPEPPDEPPSIGAVAARDRTAATSKDRAVTLVLRGDAPCDPTGAANPAEPCDGVGDDVPLTFSIVSGPANGSLSALTQGSGVPQRTARVTYTPDLGFTSPPDDVFTFEACGIVASVEECDLGTVTVDVVEAQAEARTQRVTTPEETPVSITLQGDPGFPGGEKTLALKAAFSSASAVAGNVAATNIFNGGDNVNALPGPTPVLMSAAVNSTGGPGSNGVVRMHMEWSLQSIAPLADEITAVTVVLNTEKGTVDSLDTDFFTRTVESIPPDGLLTVDDFNSAVAPNGVTMSVPDVPNGTQGTFSFDITAQVQDLLASGGGGLVVQGRVPNELAGGGLQRGLQVRTSADGNRAQAIQPQLAVTTSGVVRPLSFSLVTLPANGSLADEFGSAIGAVPASLVTPRVTYTPDAEFAGTDSFVFQVDNGLTTGTAVVQVIVGSGGTGDCEDEEDGCDDGR